MCNCGSEFCPECGMSPKLAGHKSRKKPDSQKESQEAEGKRPITSEWLHEKWVSRCNSGQWQIEGFTGMFYFDFSFGMPSLVWQHTGNTTGTFVTRKQFCDLAAALGLTPRQ